MTVYHHFVTEIERLAREARSYPLGGFPSLPKVTPTPNAPHVLIFSPHPDDECIIGGLPLRLMREASARVTNVAVTLGSKRERQNERWTELLAACNYLGFGCIRTQPQGLEKVNPKTRIQDPAFWRQGVNIIRQILIDQAPQAILFPHDTDWNSTHVGVHWLLVDALQSMPPDFKCLVFETEFWGAMASPNLMVESSVVELGDLVTATSFHVGEVQRNPYHLLLPAWMQDNVRRGGELVGGQGAAAPNFHFATIYRARRWSQGQLHYLYQGGRQIASDQSIAEFLQSLAAA